MNLDAITLYEVTLDECMKAKKEAIEYKALYMQVSKELEELKNKEG